MKHDIVDEKIRTLIIFFTLVLSMLRMLQQTSLHPRLALITGTLSFAAGHLMHALIVAVAVMCSFAALGEWRFGIKCEEFSSFRAALATEVSLFYAPGTIAGWDEEIEVTVYVMLLLFMMTLLVLNFILAIIVESYMQVRKEIEAQLTELSFPEDLVVCMQGLVHQYCWKWPSSAQLGARLSIYKFKHSVGYRSLSTKNGSLLT